MKNVVVGTAGHIDHGKTTLVKYLSGVDTDRLEEEKKRGMTIELGFAPLTLPSGNIVSIIDVPGHEKFVKTMVAGVSGIDFVLLVIAADEGIMPQTREHLDILSILNVKAGVVVLTKTDLIDDEWLEMVKADVEKVLKNTTLEGIPIVPVSSTSGSGMEKLIEHIEELTLKAANTNSQELFRLPVDRVFTMTGHGTVITGTVAGGKINKGDMVDILPAGLSCRVRGIQVHNQSVESAGAGDRCALNLAGIEKKEVERGAVIASQGLVGSTKLVDAVLYMVKDKGSLVHNQRVHVNIGTKEVLARVRILGVNEINGGDKGYVQLRFEEPLVALRKDRFVIRSYSPVVTVGGGWIISHRPRNKRRFAPDSMEALTLGEIGNLKEILANLLQNTDRLMNLEDLWRELYEDREELEAILNEEINSGKILYLKETGKYLSHNLFNRIFQKINQEFEILYKKYPFRYQLVSDEVKSKTMKTIDLKDFSDIVSILLERKLLEMEGKFLKQPGRTVVNRILQIKETGLLEKALLEVGLVGTNIQQIGTNLHLDNVRIEEILKFLIGIGKAADLGAGIFVHMDALKGAVKKVRKILNDKSSVTAGEVRDALGIGRKVAIALLEYLDALRVTQRIDDVRKPGVHYMDYFI